MWRALVVQSRNRLQRSNFLTQRRARLIAALLRGGVGDGKVNKYIHFLSFLREGL